MWPSYDAVDLLVYKKGVSGKFAIDVKDYISPVSLARNFKGFKKYSKARKLILVPDYLYKRIPNYRKMFERARKSLPAGMVELMSFKEFIEVLKEY